MTQHELLVEEELRRFEHHIDGLAHGDPYLPMPEAYWDALMADEESGGHLYWRGEES